MPADRDPGPGDPGRPPSYPVNLVLAGRRCLVVGGGPVAARKVRGLLECGALVTVVAPEVSGELVDQADLARLSDLTEPGAAPRLTIERRPYRNGEVAGYRLVVTATGRSEVDGSVAADAESAGVWVNSADDPSHCTVLLPSVHRQGPVTVAVSTDGASPAFSAWLRRRLGDEVGPWAATAVELLAEGRAAATEQGGSTGGVDWVGLLDGPFLDLVVAGDLAAAQRLVTEAVGRPTTS